MEFIETRLFTRFVHDYISDDGYRDLQQALVTNPEAGSIIKGAGGIRKLRWNAKGKGKRGGVRIIYYWYSAHSHIYLLTLYSKNEKADLTAEDRKTFRKIVETWTNE
ncbi:MAG: type II toxin-antitoxin system RelE/ParE family toxin [Nitrospinae bacterium]|nr:type II toxin-antitoxin system RelE/ParE family toxin [Nitrospinota bacterium]